MIAIIAFNLIIGCLTTKYLLDYWGSYVKHGRVDMPLAPCMLAGLFVGEATVPWAIATSIL